VEESSKFPRSRSREGVERIGIFHGRSGSVEESDSNMFTGRLIGSVATALLAALVALTLGCVANETGETRADVGAVVSGPLGQALDAHLTAQEKLGLHGTALVANHLRHRFDHEAVHRNGHHEARIARQAVHGGLLMDSGIVGA
jgi:hypothetical protein